VLPNVGMALRGAGNAGQVEFVVTVMLLQVINQNDGDACKTNQPIIVREEDIALGFNGGGQVESVRRSVAVLSSDPRRGVYDCSIERRNLSHLGCEKEIEVRQGLSLVVAHGFGAVLQTGDFACDNRHLASRQVTPNQTVEGATRSTS
jgi:hypothetical protein